MSAFATTSSSITRNATSAISAFATTSSSATRNITSSISAFATVNSSAARSSSVSISAFASLSSTANRQSNSSLSAYASLTTSINRDAVSAISAFATVNANSTRTSSTTLSAFATVNSSGVVAGGPSGPSSVTIVGKAYLDVNATYNILCTCPPWIVSNDDVCAWQTPTTTLVGTYVVTESLNDMFTHNDQVNGVYNNTVTLVKRFTRKGCE
jgi:hypothetical protein